MVAFIKIVLGIMFVFGIGGLGGLYAPSLLSSLSSRIPSLHIQEWLGGFKNQTVIVNKSETIVVEQEQIIAKSYKKALPSLVGIQSLKKDSVLANGQGFLVSSDGLILTRREWVSASADAISVVWQGNTFSATVAKKSDEFGIVLLKIDRSNLPVVTFREARKELGSSVVLVSVRPDGVDAGLVVNTGIIKSNKASLAETNIKEDFAVATGTPLLDLEGNVVGINAVNSLGYVFFIPVDAIKKFMQ